MLPCRVPNVTPPSNSVDLSVDSTTTIIAPSSQNFGSSRSSQVIKPSSYLKDFHCYYVSHNNVPTAHPFSHVLSYDCLSSNHKAFVCAISSHSKPTTYSQAMMVELKALENNGTWTLTTLPISKRPVGCKWVYHIKYQLNGSLERYKARLVAKGHTQ